MLAAALARAPHIDVDVYEAAREFKEIGAGVGMWPRSWKIMQALGLAQGLSQIAIIPPQDMMQVTFDFRKGDQPHGGTTFQQLATPGRPPDYHDICSS